MDILQKERIKACFNKAWKTYDWHCSVQKLACEKAIELLGQLNLCYEAIADFACGTGISTQLLQDHVKFEKLYAIDFSEKLLEVAKQKSRYQDINYILADFDSLIFENDHLDLAFSNMGFQWSMNLTNTLNIINGYLKSTGVLVFSIPMVGTFRELKSSSKNSLFDHHDIVKVLQHAGYGLLKYNHAVYVERFDSPLEAIRSIKSVGANCLLSENRNGRARLTKKNIQDNFNDNENLSLTYHIGTYIAQKDQERA